MRRLMALALVLVAIPVGAWAIAGSGSHARAAVARVQPHAAAGRGVRHARGVLIPNQGGSACFVAAGACSEIPCTEFVQSQSTVLVAPMAGPVTPSRTRRCPGRAVSPARPPTSGTASRIPGTVPIDQAVITGALARASRALERRTAHGGG